MPDSNPVLYLHPDRKAVLPLEVFRGAQRFTATITSGADLSGSPTVVYAVSSPVRARLLNAEIFNNEAGWIELEFRDGSSIGDRVAGPWRVGAFSRFPVPYEEIVGASVTSGVVAQVLSGFTARPLSNDGVKVNVSLVRDPTDFYE